MQGWGLYLGYIHLVYSSLEEVDSNIRHSNRKTDGHDMTQDVWQDPPSIPLLQWLARGSLKQNLAQAVRLWVWLQLLYGPELVRLELPEPFSYAFWRDAFFRNGHPTGEAKPTLHSDDCPCGKTTDAWLFAPSLTFSQAEWERYMMEQRHQPLVQQKIQQLKQDLAEHDALPKDFETFLHRTRLFGVTRRTLANDLHTLVDIHWLKRQGQMYSRVSQWPIRPMATPTHPASLPLGRRDLAFLIQPDLAAIANNLSNDIQGTRRFFVHVDYVVAQQWIDRVDEWQARLQTIWQQQPVPPVKLGIQRAGEVQTDAVVVYPVCIYYYRRGPYLCGYGQVPSGETDRHGLGWRNYRLDRIEHIDELDWKDAGVPATLLQQFQNNALPSPDDIETRMAEAWGFDYYQPEQVLLLRFDQTWNRRYIRNSLRHDTFESIEYEAIATLINKELTGPDRKAALDVWRSRSPQDAYYQALYRRDDPNVRQRIRAWRPHVEVLLPWALRQRMIREIQQEAEFYAQAGEV